MTNFRTTQGDNGATISPHTSDTISVELPEVPTSGFRWAYHPSGSDILLFQGDNFQPGNQAAIGGGGIHLFRFSVQKSGSTQILCTLTRSWESASPRDSFTLYVTAT